MKCKIASGCLVGGLCEKTGKCHALPSAEAPPEVASPVGSLAAASGSPVPVDSVLSRMNYDFHRLDNWDKLRAVIKAGVLDPAAVRRLPLDFWTDCQAFAQRVGSLQRLPDAVQPLLPPTKAQENVRDEQRASTEK